MLNMSHFKDDSSPNGSSVRLFSSNPLYTGSYLVHLFFFYPHFQHGITLLGSVSMLYS